VTVPTYYFEDCGGALSSLVFTVVAAARLAGEGRVCAFHTRPNVAGCDGGEHRAVATTF